MQNGILARAAGVAAALSLAGCATSPGKIEAAYVSPMKYQNYDCSQVAVERASVETRTNELFGSLKKRRKHDNAMMGVGLIVAWPALFFLKGNSGKKTEYRQLLGDYEALRQTSVAKKCDIEFQSVGAETKARAAEGTNQ